jgi:hypothetical protein
MIAKRKNHFVWQHYLKTWSQNKRDVFYTTQSRNISYDSVKGLAMERDFYKCQPLSSTQLEIIRLTSLKADPDTQKHHTEILDNYIGIQRREQLLQMLPVKSPEAERILDALKSNFLENLHTQIENLAKPILTKLAEGDVAIFQNSQNLCNFLMFLGHQTVRTQAFKEDYLAATMSATNGDERIRKELDGCWWFLSYMFGVNIGSSIFKQKTNLTFCLLEAPEGTNFITSDQPVINVHEELTDGIKAPEMSDLYFPISPNFAFMVNDSDRFPNGLSSVAKHFVQSMNEKISRRAEKTIFGLTAEDIQPYRKSVGARRDDVKRHLFGQIAEE